MTDLLLQALLEQELEVEENTLLPARGWVSTGNFALNWAVSGRFTRGWPLGHMVELFGDPACGKSYLLMNAIREFQRLTTPQSKAWVVFDDSEGSYNPEWANRLGVDSLDMYKVHSETVLQHQEVVEKSLEALDNMEKKDRKKYGTGLFGLDSLGQLSTQHETEVGIGTQDMSKAREVKAAMRLLSHKINAHEVCYIATNHTYANVGNMYNPRTSSGGSGLKFAAGIRVDLRSPTKLKAPNGLEIGVGINVYIEKSRFTAPWKKIRINIPFYAAVQPTSGLLPVLEQLGVVVVKSNNIVVGETDTKIPFHKSDSLKQDYSAIKLLEMFPDLITKADEAAVRFEKDAAVLKDAGEVVENGKGA